MRREDPDRDRAPTAKLGPRFDRELEVLRLIVDRMADGLMVVDEQNRIIYFNQVARQILGFGPIETEPGQRSEPFGLFRADGSELIPAAELPLARALRGESVSGYEILVRNPRRPSGVFIRVDSRPLPDDQGQLAGAVATFRDVTVTRRSREVVKRLSTAIERTGDSILITDEAGRITYVNRAFELRTGYSRKEALGATPRILKSGEHPPEFYERLWSTILDGREFRDTILNRKKSGEFFWSEQTITPVRNSQGHTTQFVSVLKDVTHREAELRHQRDFNAAILSATDTLVMVVDSSGRLVLFNPACERISGYKQKEILGQALLDLPLIAEDTGPWQARLESVRVDGDPVTAELGWSSRTGEPRVVQWSLRGLRGEEGRVSHVVIAGVDVTESRSARQALEQSERRYRLLVENLHEGLWLIDESNRTTFVNERMAQMLSYPVHEMMGRPIFDFLDEPGVSLFEGSLNRRRKGGHEDVETELVARDGRQICTIMQCSPVIDPDGTYRGSLQGVLDITDRKQDEKALRAARDGLELRVDERTAELQVALDEVERLKDRLEAENVLLREEVRRVRSGVEIVGSSRAIQAALDQVRRVAPTDSSVLLLGETGTGKGLFAEAIHEASSLSERPLVTVDCAALPPTLIESELFGHERGAFTGATRQRPGRFEMADGGTLFLDEIGDMPTELQPKLLRVLQSGEFERVGSGRTRRVGVRVIAATNRDLRSRVDRGQFRADLYFRLSVYPISIPPLRERREDIPALARHLLESLDLHGRPEVLEIHPDVLDLLQSYHWPGNVRELANTVERAMITCSGGRLTLEGVRASLDSHTGRPTEDSDPHVTLFERERAHIVKILERCRWRIKGRGNAADRLGLAASTLRDRMKKLGISRPR